MWSRTEVANSRTIDLGLLVLDPLTAHAIDRNEPKDL
jgi:hypothetical protein